MKVKVQANASIPTANRLTFFTDYPRSTKKWIEHPHIYTINLQCPLH